MLSWSYSSYLFFRASTGIHLIAEAGCPEGLEIDRQPRSRGVRLVEARAANVG